MNGGSGRRETPRHSLWKSHTLYNNAHFNIPMVKTWSSNMKKDQNLSKINSLRGLQILSYALSLEWFASEKTDVFKQKNEKELDIRSLSSVQWWVLTRQRLGTLTWVVIAANKGKRQGGKRKLQHCFLLCTSHCSILRLRDEVQDWDMENLTSTFYSIDNPIVEVREIGIIHQGATYYEASRNTLMSSFYCYQ